MVLPTPISNTPSLANQASPQEIQQRREIDTARRLYAEQERRNQEIRRREEEERAADQQRKYDEYSNAVDEAIESRDNLRNAAEHYNALVDKYEAAKTNEEKFRLRDELELARNVYNNSSREFAEVSQRYNAATEAAIISGAIDSDVKPISYKQESIKSPFEGTEADLAALQKERRETQRILDNLESQGNEFNFTADLLEKRAGKYNLLAEQYNAANTQRERDLLQPKIQSAAAELNSLSFLLQETGKKFNSTLNAAKERGLVEKESVGAQYEYQEVNPIFFRESNPSPYPAVTIPEGIEGITKDIKAGNFKILGTEHPEYGELLIADNTKEKGGNTISYSGEMLKLAGDISKTGNPLEKAAANYYLWQNDESAVGSAAWYEKTVSDIFGKDITQKIDTGQTQRDNRENLAAGILNSPAQTARILSAGAFGAVGAARGISEGKRGDVLSALGGGASGAVLGTIEYAKDNPWGFAGSVVGSVVLGKAAGGVVKTIKNTRVSVTIPKVEKTFLDSPKGTVLNTKRVGGIDFGVYDFGIQVKGKLQKLESPSTVDVNSGFSLKAGNTAADKAFLQFVVEKKRGVMADVKDVPGILEAKRGNYSVKQTAAEISPKEGYSLRAARETKQREASISGSRSFLDPLNREFIQEEISGIKFEKGSRSLIGMERGGKESFKEKAQVTHIEDITRKKTITRPDRSVDVFETHDFEKRTTKQPRRDNPVDSPGGFTKSTGGSDVDLGNGMLGLEKPSFKSEGKSQTQSVQSDVVEIEKKPTAAQKPVSKKKSGLKLITPVNQRTTFTQGKTSGGSTSTTGGLIFADKPASGVSAAIQQSQLIMNRPSVKTAGYRSSSLEQMFKAKKSAAAVVLVEQRPAEAKSEDNDLIIMPIPKPITKTKETSLQIPAQVQAIQYKDPRTKKNKLKSKWKEGKGNKKNKKGIDDNPILKKHWLPGPREFLGGLDVMKQSKRKSKGKLI